MTTSDQRIIVTGAAGFIGSHVSDRLVRDGWSVLGIDSFNDFYPRAIKERNIADLASHDRFNIAELDITDADAMRVTFEKFRPQAVIHLAARAGVRPSIEQPQVYTRVNVNGTVNLFEAAIHAGVSRFVMASSSSVYGNCGVVPFREDMSVDHPISPYAATKKACELLAHTYTHLHGMPISCLRFFTVYGPRQRPDLAISKFMRRIAAGQSIPVFGDGSTSRDYTYIDDIVDGVLAALQHCDRYRVYNLGGHSPITLAELIAAIERTVGTKAIIDRKPMQPGDVDRTYADLTRSTAELGFSPRITIDEGLARHWAWLREQPTTFD